MADAKGPPERNAVAVENVFVQGRVEGETPDEEIEEEVTAKGGLAVSTGAARVGVDFPRRRASRETA